MSSVYERLRQRLDKFPQGFPKTESGVELEILQHLFTTDEAELMLHLRPFPPENVTAIAERTGKGKTELGRTLFDMSKRGLIMRYKAPDNELYYALIPWVVGIWELQLNNLTQENIKLYEKYFEEGMAPAQRNRKLGGLRVIPVEQEIEGSTEIQPYERVSQIIESHTRFAVADCICRKEADMLGKGCDKLLEACMSFGASADFYIENGLGREISKEEAKEILLRAEEDGLIHCSLNSAGNKVFICNCCGCCCKSLAQVTKYGNLQGIVKSNYYATKDQETCTSCGTCVERCQVNAVTDGNEHIVIDRSKCIGCGLCATTCPTESITMVRKSHEEASPIFSKGKELLQAMGKETGKEYPFE
ncbi:MAG: 4Fe-4S binding protein [Chloroflexota bacterium]|nr:MAG: 4Fe-4S binding protein [Chloroflexota bacterium]